MGKPQARRKGIRSKKKGFKKSRITKRRAKDLDQIQDELKRELIGEPKAMLRLAKVGKLDEDLPGLGQWYCAECDRYFITANTKKDHLKTKGHKKRCKLIKEKPYSQAEADYGAH